MPNKSYKIEKSKRFKNGYKSVKKRKAWNKMQIGEEDTVNFSLKTLQGTWAQKSPPGAHPNMTWR